MSGKLKEQFKKMSAASSMAGIGIAAASAAIAMPMAPVMGIGASIGAAAVAAMGAFKFGKNNPEVADIAPAVEPVIIEMPLELQNDIKPMKKMAFRQRRFTVFA